MNFQDYPITIALIIANVIFSLIGFSNAALVDKTIMWPYSPVYFNYLNTDFISVSLYKSLSTVILNKAK